MKKIIKTTALVLSLAVALIVAAPAFAADLSFAADTTIALTNPAINATILSGSSADSITVNAGSVNVTMSGGQTFTFRSTDRKALTHNSNALAVDYTCNDSYSQVAVTNTNTSGSSFTISVSSDTCATTGGSSSTGGAVIVGGGGVSSTTPVPTATTAETTTPTPATTTTETPTTSVNAGALQWQQVLTDTAAVFSGDVVSVLANAGTVRNTALETSAASAYTKILTAGVSNLTTSAISAITNFIAYGTKSTQILGAGERAGVVNSYKKAYDKLPTSETTWKDAIAIANGRWPAETNANAESQAKTEFKKVYKRDADMKNAHDNAAVTVIAYGLRPSARNLNSEKAAIKIFKAIYGHNPVSALAWDIVRAIAYSGAKR